MFADITTLMRPLLSVLKAILSPCRVFRVFVDISQSPCITINIQFIRTKGACAPDVYLVLLLLLLLALRALALGFGPKTITETLSTICLYSQREPNELMVTAMRQIAPNVFNITILLNRVNKVHINM